MYDIKNLAKLKRLDEKNPQAMKAFWAFDKAAFAPGAIDVLNRWFVARVQRLSAGYSNV